LGGYKETCKVCHEIFDQFVADGDIPHGSVFKQCDNCPAVELQKDNFAAWDVYTRCWNQVICAGMGDIIGVNLLAVYRVMQSLKIREDDELQVVDKVILLHDKIHGKKKDSNVAQRTSATARKQLE